MISVTDRGVRFRVEVERLVMRIFTPDRQETPVRRWIGTS